MDALAGYGSDDSSVRAEQAAGDTRKSALEELIASDSDECDRKVKEESFADQTTREQPASKKSRIESNISVKLPEPALAKGDNDSWILWKTNYLQMHPITNEEEQPFLQLENPPNTVQIQNNLQRLARNIGKDVRSWADHLRAQQEFHNPHFFASVVDHFGIETPLASFLGDAEVQEYERELFPLATSEGT